MAKAPLAPRSGHVALWTGRQMIVWAGADSSKQTHFGDGAAYDPTTDRWTVLAEAPLALRTGAMAAWTGKKMLVWGGERAPFGESDSNAQQFSDGAAYDPTTDSWTPMAPPPAGFQRGDRAFWTPNGWLIWGGTERSPSAAIYSPDMNRWTQAKDSPLSRPHTRAAVWTGRQMIVFAGADEAPESVEVASYDPAADEWTPANPLTGPWNDLPVAVWTGRQLVLWGGQGALDAAAPDLAAYAYDPTNGNFIKRAPAPIRPGGGARGVWTGSRILVWGGLSEPGDDPNSPQPGATGAAFDPKADRWTLLAPSIIAARFDHSAVWTGSLMLIWGGIGLQNQPLADGAGYAPAREGR